ncbi:hypothetical protein FBR07_02595 [Candidatus Uhrbacteria bacterium UHB]|nr:hypothetical protein [Candidatus Uhrbacteria bacterium UHB]RIL00167.1 MAG: hypothetical protein DCC77_04765 [Candidatus Uhrbacteria bacterium]
MASHYTDPRDFVLHIRGELLAEYLKERHGKNNFPIGNKEETSEQRADRFIEYIKAQNDDALRDRVYMELEYINSLSSENHIAAFCTYAPNINRDEHIEKKCQNNDERALAAFTQFPTEFDNYYSYANIEEFVVKELTLPSTVPLSDITEARIQQFEPMVQAVYQKTYKGEKCKIKSWPDKDKIILRAYLEDLPTRDIGFDGKRLDEKRVRKPVFDVVFVYKPELKMLGVRALGGDPIIKEMQKLFCSHFLGIENVKTDEIRYQLPTTNGLANLKLEAPNASYGIERAYLKSIRLKNKGVPHTLFVDVGGRAQYAGTGAAQQILKDLGLDLNKDWEVKSIKITVVFKQTGKGRRKQVPVTITPPNTCALKNRPQDDVVRKFLKDLGIYVA